MRASFFFILTFLAFQASAQEVSFDAWKSPLREEAVARGIEAPFFDRVMQNVEPLEDVVALDRKQPESTKTFAQYLAATVNGARTKRGREYAGQYRDLLNRVSERYGVPAQYILALWGKETDFGDNTGGFPIIDSLATLAYDGRRSAFFREELLKALIILQDEPVPASDFLGSWAGAMGQCQFMPSSYLQFAVDDDGDGRKDIWYSQGDVFASIANYLSQSGWDNSVGWGGEVILPASFDHALADGKTKYTLSEWQALGVAWVKPNRIPADRPLTLFFPDKNRTAAYLATSNYDVIMKWNRSRYFATAVGTLADTIAQ